MAAAIAAHVREVQPNARLAVDKGFGTFEQRARYQFRAINGFSIRSLSRAIGELAPRPFREYLGLVNRSEIGALLDASGFAFSDQWGIEPARWMNRSLRLHMRRYQKVIFLPQAFGPFNNPELAHICREMFARADLIYARDVDSLEAMKTLGTAKHLKLSPDFTVLLKGVPPPALHGTAPFVAIVPNYRMLDKTTDQDGELYLRFLNRSVIRVRKAGLEPLVILHDENEDRRLLPGLFALTGKLRVFEARDPIVLKGALSMAQLVIGSRFHALVSSLSEGVPCVGVGWSHKYKRLFEDFGCSDYFANNLDDLDLIDDLIDNCITNKRVDLIKCICERGDAQKAQVREMWAEIDECLGLLDVNVMKAD